MDFLVWIFAGVAAAWIETDHRRDSATAVASRHLTPSRGNRRAGRCARPAACVADIPGNFPLPNYLVKHLALVPTPALSCSARQTWATATFMEEGNACHAGLRTKSSNITGGALHSDRGTKGVMAEKPGPSVDVPDLKVFPRVLTTVRNSFQLLR